MDFFKNIHSEVKNFWNNSTNKKKASHLLLGATILLTLIIVYSWSSPTNFPLGTTVRIEKGMTLGSATMKLKDSGYIRSEFWFKAFVTIFGGPRSVVAGDYHFAKKETIVNIARRVVKGNYGLTQIRITIPESLTNAQIAKLFKQQFSLFDEEAFMNDAIEGEMFPDTYFFLVNVTTLDVISRMKQNFDEKIKSINLDIASSTRPLEQVLIMASILEEEAKTRDDRKMIADILWKRLDIGMALQVDSALETYERRGLPDKPISNPGLEAILDALYPTKTPYFYFLSDLRGKVYYAEDFDGHQRNRELYFKK